MRHYHESKNRYMYKGSRLKKNLVFVLNGAQSCMSIYWYLYLISTSASAWALSFNCLNTNHPPLI